MPTSIRDLIHALEGEASTDRQSRDAAGALSVLGRALRQLAQDGLDLQVDGHREALAGDLADSCEQNGVAVVLDRGGRLTGLAGGVADVVGLLREETGRDERWAIAVEVASAARVLTTYVAEADGRRTADLVWTHSTARALIVQALKDTPAVRSRAVLDRPVPRTMPPPDAGGAGAALESLTVISDRLRRSSAELTRRPTLLEVFAVTRAAQSTARYATAAAAALAGEPAPDARAAAAIWHEVRDRLKPFSPAAPPHLEDRDLATWAQRAHSELRREFGSADAPQLFEPDGRVKGTAVGHLQAMANEIPAIADHVAAAVRQLADHGELHALANRLPFREQRLDQFLNRRAVVADRFDVAAVMDRLGDAATLGAEVATSLNLANGPAQPDLAAANAARAGAPRADPHAALAAHLRDGTGTADDAAAEPAGAAADMTADLRAGTGLDYETDYPATPDWGVE